MGMYIYNSIDVYRYYLSIYRSIYLSIYLDGSTTDLLLILSMKMGRARPLYPCMN